MEWRSAIVTRSSFGEELAVCGVKISRKTAMIFKIPGNTRLVDMCNLPISILNSPFSFFQSLTI